MENINDYLETAIEKNGLKNQSALARTLDMTTGGLSSLKKQKCHPSPETMIKLAKLCDVPPEVALCDLGRWNENREVSGFYENISKILHKGLNSLLAILLFTAIFSSHNVAEASTNITTNSHTLYIMENM